MARKKRSRSRPAGPKVTAEQIQALERDLDDSIDAFREDFELATETGQSACGRSLLDTATFGETNGENLIFPSIVDNAGPWFSRAPEPEPPPELPELPELPKIAQVAEPVAAIPIAPKPKDDRALIDSAAARLREYLGRLITQLNTQHPPIGRSYEVAPGCTIDGVRWNEGYVNQADMDYESAARSSAFEIYFTLFAPGAVTLSVDQGMSRITVDRLIRHDLAFTMHDRSFSAHTGQAQFSIQRQVRACLKFMPHYGSASLTLEARHLVALGVRHYWIDPAALDAPAMRDIAEFILGRTGAPPAILSQRLNP